MEITGREVRTIGWMIKTPAGNVLAVESCVADRYRITRQHRHQTSRAACSECAFKNFIIDRILQSAGAGIRASVFNRYNDATVRTREVPLVYASCDVIILSHIRSRFTQ